MSAEIFTQIPFKIDGQELIDSLHLGKHESMKEMLYDFIGEAEKIAVPKGIYKKMTVSDRDSDSIVIQGYTFHSKILAENTKNKPYVFPYVITCGMEIEKWSENNDDIMEQFIIDGIKGMIVTEGAKYIQDHIQNEYNIDDISYHIPGFLDDWSIYEQKELFQLLGEEVKSTGVFLTQSSLMRPTKSVSGLYY